MEYHYTVISLLKIHKRINTQVTRFNEIPYVSFLNWLLHHCNLPVSKDLSVLLYDQFNCIINLFGPHNYSQLGYRSSHNIIMN